MWDFYDYGHLRVADAARLQIGKNSDAFSVHCWGMADSTGSESTMMARFYSVAPGAGPVLRHTGGHKLSMYAVDSGNTGREAVSAASISNDVMYSFGGAYDGATTLKCSLNGVIATGACTAPLASSYGDVWRFGSRAGTTGLQLPWDGKLGEFAIWNVCLTDAEFGALARGVPPSMIRRANLVGYWPGWGRPEPVSAYATEVLADNPLLYWRMKETSGTVAEDETANNRDGTYTNGPVLHQGGAIATDGASDSVFFDGTNDYCVNGAALNPSNCTIELWYEYSGTPPGASNLLAGCMNGYGSGTTDKQLYITTAGKVQFYVYDGNTRFNVITAQSALAAGWHHIVATVDGECIRVYIDGVAGGAGTPAVGSFTGYSVGNFFAGGASSVYGQLAGKRSEVAFYDHALTSDRVAAHYAAAQGTLNPVPFDYDFVGGSGGKATPYGEARPFNRQPPVAPAFGH